jgi:hypothetical protein
MNHAIEEQQTNVFSVFLTPPCVFLPLELEAPPMNIKVTNPDDQCSLAEMLQTVDHQLDLWLGDDEKYLKDIIIDFVGLAPQFFHAQHTVGKSECESPVSSVDFAGDDMPPEIPTLAKLCGVIKEDVKLDFQKGTVRTRKSPRHAKDNQLGMWSLTPNEAGDDWIISVEVPGYMQRAELTFSDVFASNPNLGSSSPTPPGAVSPSALLDLPPLPSVPSFSLSPSPEISPMMPFLMVPALSPQTSWSSLSLSSDLDSDCGYFSVDDVDTLEGLPCLTVYE